MTDREPTLVLVVDDDELVRKSLGRNLRRLGCEVLLAADGEQALRIASEARPALIFLDLRMPGMDGHNVLERLHAIGVLASVVVMSGQGDIDDVIETVRKGAVDYMKKPWTTNDLASVLARGIEVYAAIEGRDTRGSDAGPPEGKRIAARMAGAPRADRNGARSVPLRSPDKVSPVAPLADIVRWLRSGDMPIPPVPATLARLRAWTRAPEPPMEDVARLVDADRDLAMTVLRLANGSFYARSTPVSDVRSAVSRVGIHQVHGLAETVALRQWRPLRAPSASAFQERIWRFSVARGLAMRAIADVTGPEIGLDGDRCYLAGLLLDIGASFLLWTLDERTPTDAAHHGTAEVAGSTVQAVATYHAAFGEAILTHWGLADIAALAGEHHGETSPVAASGLWSAAVLAGPLARRLVDADDPTSTHRSRPELLDRCAYSLGLGETVLRRLALALTDDAREIWAVYA